MYLLGVELNLTVAHMTQRLEDERKISEEAIANSNKYSIVLLVLFV